jgi:hypothetical protein
MIDDCGNLQSEVIQGQLTGKQDKKTGAVRVQDRTPPQLMFLLCVSYPAALRLELCLVNDVWVWDRVVRVVLSHKTSAPHHLPTHAWSSLAH